MVTVPNREITNTGIKPITGSVREIRESLQDTDNNQFVVFQLAHANKSTASAFAEAVRLIAPLIIDRLAIHKTATLKKLVDALVPAASPPEHLVTEARMNADARQTVLESAEWISAVRLSEIAGFKGQNASAQPNKWKREGKVFALRHDGNDLYPAYALDRDMQYRPIKGLVPILKVFKGKLDAWDIAIWFASANSFLGGTAPKDLLKSAPERVLAAAEDEIAGVLHG